VNGRSVLWLLVLVVSSAFGESADRPVVVVELFTSQGCSSCPPADKLLSQLVAGDLLDDIDVIGISEHVDYWNSLGWVDPFSDSRFSERQRAYGRAASRFNAYTPQMIVDGKVAFVGHDRVQAIQAIREAAKRPRAKLDLTLDGLELTVEISYLPKTKHNVRYDVMLALIEDGIEVEVSRGENAGRVLMNDGVARRIQRIGLVRSEDGMATVVHTIEMQSDWDRENMRVVVFLQSRRDMAIAGAIQR